MTDVITEKEYEFNLQSEDVFEDFAIWSSYDKKGQDIKDVDGNSYEFPIKDGTLKGTDGQVRDIELLKKMPNMIFKRLYPDLTKNTKYLRPIYYAGVECFGRFSMTSNRLLTAMIETIKQSGGDPLKAIFKQTFDSKARPQNMYNIQVVGKVGEVPNQPPLSTAATAPQTPMTTETVAPPVPKVNIDVPEVKDVSLNAIEQALLDALKKVDKLDEEKFTAVCNNNAITDGTRIKELFVIYNG